MHIAHRSTALFVLSMLVGSTLPMASTQALFRSEGGTFRSAAGEEVTVRRGYTLRDRRNYNRALEIWKEYIRQGHTDMVKPSINNLETVQLYLDHPLYPDRSKEDDIVDPISTKDYVKPVTDEKGEYELNAEERAALKQAIAAGKCWGWKKFSEGFAALCEQMTKGRTPVRTTGIINSLSVIKARGAAQASSAKKQVIKSRSQTRDATDDAPATKRAIYRATP